QRMGDVTDDALTQLLFLEGGTWWYSDRKAVARLLPDMLSGILSASKSCDYSDQWPFTDDAATSRCRVLYGVLHRAGLLRGAISGASQALACEILIAICEEVVRSVTLRGRPVVVGGCNWMVPHLNSMAAVVP